MLVNKLSNNNIYKTNKKMNFFKLTPEQKRLRKKEMYSEYLKRSKKPNVILYELRSELAVKYGYKNEKVVEYTIFRMKKQKELTQNKQHE